MLLFLRSPRLTRETTIEGRTTKAPRREGEYVKWPWDRGYGLAEPRSHRFYFYLAGGSFVTSAEQSRAKGNWFRLGDGNSLEIRMCGIKQVVEFSGNDNAWHLKHGRLRFPHPNIAERLARTWGRLDRPVRWKGVQRDFLNKCILKFNTKGGIFIILSEDSGEPSFPAPPATWCCSHRRIAHFSNSSDRRSWPRPRR